MKLDTFRATRRTTTGDTPSIWPNRTYGIKMAVQADKNEEFGSALK